MDASTVTISLEGALLIAASVFGTGFFIWKASSDAHKDIRNQLCNIRVDQSAMRKDIQWLVRLRGGSRRLMTQI